MVTYLLIGLIWCFWLEWYTTGNPDVKMNGLWTIRERIFHTLLWPFSLGLFVYEFLKNIL